MNVPEKAEGEAARDFMSRCMADPDMNKGYPDQDRRAAVCMGKACEDMDHVEAASFQVEYAKKKTYKYKDPKTGEVFEFDRRGLYRRNKRVLVPVHG